MHTPKLFATLAIASTLTLSVAAADKAPELFVNAMKANAASMQAIGKAIPAKDYAAIEQSAATLKSRFEVIQAFWHGMKTDDAVALAAAGLKAATDLEAAAKAKSDDGIAAAQKAVQATCGGCHMAHRTREADGTFTLK